METFTTVAGKPTINKDPNAVLDYTFDFTDWLATASDSIASASFPVTVGVVVNSSGVVAGKRVTAWISGGTVWSPASVTVRVVTSGGRTDERTINFKITER